MITNPNVKVNLGLNVLGERPDGYHDIETLFYPYFDIKDVLEITSGEDFSHTSASLFARYSADEGTLAQAITDDGKLMITIAREEGVDWDPLTDLCANAYRLLSDDFNLPVIRIFLEKLAPVGAGLGGGSADAAFTLKMLNEMCALGLSEKRLCDYASRLGSDCSFFIYDKPMLGIGRGEILTSYPLDLPSKGYDLKVIVPEGIAVSTAEAYKGLSPQPPTSALSDVLAMPVDEWKQSLKNDFEPTVFAKHPELSAIKQSLYDSGAAYASMSGSGSALFAIYKA
ncbi:MAG: 4-(cytidine 5'-diphospho)-2-C-methyl-D-erythritol kinase [Bacteroidales bacterium]